VTCLEVRELLPELAVDTIAPEDRTEVERHLQWCAGCRKEASDLGQAAAILAFSLTPATVPQGLGERVVDRVRRATGSSGTPRRARTVAAAIVAAMVAVASLGWGAVMAGRADRFADRAEQAQRERAQAIEQFQKVLAPVVPGVEISSNDDAHLGQLAPVAGGTGGAAVLQLVSPTLLDFVFVIVNGLSDDADLLPYRVQLSNAAGQELRAGRIDELDSDGGAEVFRQFQTQDLTGFSTVTVVDSSGEVVLTGTVDQTP
jgi:putative zinc finger protein